MKTYYEDNKLKIFSKNKNLHFKNEYKDFFARYEIIKSKGVKIVAEDFDTAFNFCNKERIEKIIKNFIYDHEEEKSESINKYDFIANGINEKVIKKLIIQLQKYKEEEYFDTYKSETLIKDVIFFLGKSFDKKKYNYAGGFEKFVEEVKKIL